MFGKKKDTGIPVQHYEGLKDFPQDFPCKIEVKGSIFEIRKVKPEVTITLPMERITTITAMEEANFMLKYHGDKATTHKGNMKKFYLVVNYTTVDGSEAMLAFWGTSFEWQKFIDLQSCIQSEAKSYSL